MRNSGSSSAKNRRIAPSKLSANRRSSTIVAARGEGSLAVLAHVHRAPDGIPVGHAFEYVADAGSFVAVVAVAAHVRALHFSAEVARQKLSAMAALQFP